MNDWISIELNMFGWPRCKFCCFCVFLASYLRRCLGNLPLHLLLAMSVCIDGYWLVWVCMCFVYNCGFKLLACLVCCANLQMQYTLGASLGAIDSDGSSWMFLEIVVVIGDACIYIWAMAALKEDHKYTRLCKH